MSTTTISMNFPMLPNGAGTIMGTCNAFIDYTLPAVTIDHFRFKVTTNTVFEQTYPAITIKVNRVKGKFRQFDSSNNLLKEDDFDITQGNSQTFPAQSGVTWVEVYIYYMETWGSYQFYISPDAVNNGTGNEIFRLSTEDPLNNETSAVSVIVNKVIVAGKNRETITVTGSPPVRVFSITTTNTGSYIKEWWAEIKSVTGTPQPSDTLVLELLDANDNVLASNSVGIAVGNKIAVQHQSSGAKIRVTLNSNVRALIVEVDISEGVDITVS